ncbi:hypothetical protein Tco_0930876 [Tanacetum coccineum]
MAGMSDEELESILSDFDQIHNSYREGVAAIEALEWKCNIEIKKRESLQFTANTLKSGTFETRNNCRSLKEELKRVNDELARKENEFRNALSLLRHDYENRMKELDVQIKDSLAQKAAKEAIIIQLHKELTAHRNHVEALAKRLDHVHSDVDMRYQNEIQDLKDCLMMEQEEKNELNRKLHNLEKELLISKTKLAAENKQDLSSNRNVENLKQKVMKLRKENEVLKRRLLDSKDE